MFSHDQNASATSMDGVFRAAGFSAPSGPAEEPSGRAPRDIDDFLDRMPSWILHAAGVVTALVGVWFALALLGGLPVDVVEWILLAMFGAFAYALGFMVALVVAFVVDGASRSSMLFVFLAFGATAGVLSLPMGA